MREQWARRIAFFTGQLVLVFAVAFALKQNPVKTPETTESQVQAPLPALSGSGVLDPKRIAAGRRVYEQQICTRCHSVAGEGNPRNPLDDVGAKRPAEELYNWIIGADSLQDALPASVFKVKQVFGELPGDDLDALVIYLQSLRIIATPNDAAQ